MNKQQIRALTEYAAAHPPGHTPGPWEVNGGRIEAENAYTSKAHVIAVVGVVNQQSHEDTANARLIAASPELLAACKDALSIIQHGRGCGPYSKAEAVLEAAIAKTEGGAA